MTEAQKTSRKPFIGIAVFFAAAVILTAVFFIFREKPAEGIKNIVIEVTGKETEPVSYDVQTDAEYLRQAMEEAEGLTFSGTESEYGLMVETVNGDTADFAADGAYWAFYVNNEYCNYGIDTQPVEDGDVFAIVYTTDTGN